MHAQKFENGCIKEPFLLTSPTSACTPFYLVCWEYNVYTR